MQGILAEIVDHTRRQLVAEKAKTPLDDLAGQAERCVAALDFAKSLKPDAPDQVAIIAECKRKSPSKGVMREPYDPSWLAERYAWGGAAAISVLTDTKYFGGHLEHLRQVRESVDIPILRKDFIVDRYQVVQARAAGADSFLLIAGVLDARQLEELIGYGRDFGMEPLVESHNDRELDIALATSARILGINNRNLSDFSVGLEHARQGIERIQEAGRIAVCESGIHSRSDIEQMREVGYNSFLIGEALVTAADPQSKVEGLLRSS